MRCMPIYIRNDTLYGESYAIRMYNKSVPGSWNCTSLVAVVITRIAEHRKISRMQPASSPFTLDKQSLRPFPNINISIFGRNATWRNLRRASVIMAIRCFWKTIAHAGSVLFSSVSRERIPESYVRRIGRRSIGNGSIARIAAFAWKPFVTEIVATRVKRDLGRISWSRLSFDSAGPSSGIRKVKRLEFPFEQFRSRNIQIWMLFLAGRDMQRKDKKINHIRKDSIFAIIDTRAIPYRISYFIFIAVRFIMSFFHLTFHVIHDDIMSFNIYRITSIYIDAWRWHDVLATNWSNVYVN